MLFMCGRPFLEAGFKQLMYFSTLVLFKAANCGHLSVYKDKGICAVSSFDTWLEKSEENISNNYSSIDRNFRIFFGLLRKEN